eukprot:6774055-Pyramimonas_sp.AAC.1
MAAGVTDATFTLGAAVVGGHLGKGSWSADAKMVAGTMFVRVAKSDRGCKRFIANQFAMLDALMAL